MKIKAICLLRVWKEAKGSAGERSQPPAPRPSRLYWRAPVTQTGPNAAWVVCPSDTGDSPALAFLQLARSPRRALVTVV